MSAPTSSVLLILLLLLLFLMSFFIFLGSVSFVNGDTLLRYRVGVENLVVRGKFSFHPIYVHSVMCMTKKDECTGGFCLQDLNICGFVMLEGGFGILCINHKVVFSYGQKTTLCFWGICVINMLVIK